MSQQTVREIDESFISLMDKYLDHGLISGSIGRGEKGYMCAQSLVAFLYYNDGTLHDKPVCVERSISNLMVFFNDVVFNSMMYINLICYKNNIDNISNSQAEKMRAKDMRDLAIAQLGSSHFIDRFTVSVGSSSCMDLALKTICIKFIFEDFLSRDMVENKDVVSQIISESDSLIKYLIEMIINIKSVKIGMPIVGKVKNHEDSIYRLIASIEKPFTYESDTVNARENILEDQISYANLSYRRYDKFHYKLLSSILPTSHHASRGAFSIDPRKNNKDKIAPTISEYYYPLVKRLAKEYVEFFKSISTEGSKYL